MAIADRAYASLQLLDRCRKLRDPITFVSRLRLDAALYERAPARRPGQIGRPRIKGERLPNLSEVAEAPKTVWEPTEIANWYGSEQRTVEIASETAVWYSTGLFAVPVRWVLVRDPQKEFKTQALLCTNLNADPKKILRWFVMRWQLEVTYQEMRRHLGFETQKAVVGVSDPMNHPGSAGTVLVGDFVCASADEAGSERLAASGGLLPQGSSDLLLGFGVGGKGAVDPGADFLRVACAEQHGKSPTGLHGTADRRGLLRSLMAKVELKGEFSEVGLSHYGILRSSLGAFQKYNLSYQCTAQGIAHLLPLPKTQINRIRARVYSYIVR